MKQKTMVWTRGAVAAAVTMVMLTGCSGEDAPPAPPPPPSPSADPYSVPKVTASPSSPAVTATPEGAPPVPQDVPLKPEAGEAAVKYLTGRDNMMSVQHQKPTDWAAAMKPLMSDRFHREVAATVVDGGQIPQGWRDMHEMGAQVRLLQPSCKVIPDPGNTDTQQSLTCSWTGQIVGRDGTPVPLSSVTTAQYQWTGPQQSAVTAVKAGDRWVVDADYSALGGDAN